MNPARIFAASLLLGAAALGFSGCGADVAAGGYDYGYYGPDDVGPGFYGGPAWYGDGDVWVHPPRGGGDHGHPAPGGHPEGHAAAPGIPHASRPAAPHAAPSRSSGGGGDRRH